MNRGANSFSVGYVQNPAAVISAYKKRESLRVPFHVIVLPVLLAAAALCVSVYWRTSTELKEARQEYAQIQTQVNQLMLDNHRLKQEINALMKNPEVIEQAAREELGLVRPGEIVIKLPEKRPQP